MRPASILTAEFSFAVVLLMFLTFFLAASPSAAPQAPASGAGLESVKLPPAPPGGLDASKLPDIVGVHIGTPTDKVIAQLNSLYPLVRNERRVQMFGPGGGNGDGKGLSYAKYAATNDPPFISSALFTRAFPEGCINPKAGSCQGGRDEMRVIFSGPPQKLSVRLERSLSWEQQPTSDNLKAALIQKYGPNFTETPQSPPIMLKWAFDEQGNALPAPPKNVYCPGIISQQGSPPPNPYSMPSYLGIYPGTSPQQEQQQLVGIMRNRCPYILVEAQINGRPGGPASQMSVVIQELPQDLRNAFAAEHYMRQSANAQANQQLKKSQQQAAPKF